MAEFVVLSVKLLFVMGEKESNIVEILRKGGPMTATEIAEKMGGGTHRTTVTRKMKLLETDRMVIKNQEGKYQLLEDVSDL